MPHVPARSIGPGLGLKSDIADWADNTTMSSSPPARSRTELINAIFKCCDSDGNGRLQKQELHRFAKHSGFDGDSQAWAEEFRSVCKEARADESAGLRLDMFQALINDSTEKGCYCTDTELRATLEALESEGCQGDANADPAAPLGTSPASAAATAMTPTLSRGVQLRDIFRLCDRDGDGFLSHREMRIFAGHTGFRGTDAEWEEEYRLLCKEIDAVPSRGLDVLQLERLTNDASNSGCYCHDGELLEIRSQLELEVRRTRLGESPGALSPSRLQRAELVQRIFRVCDSNRDGFLNSSEVKRFAARTGFEGSEDAWNAEYKFLCKDNDADPQLGISVDLFERLINDRSDNGCFCSDEELRTMLTQWTAEERHESTAAEPRPGPPEPHPRPPEPWEAPSLQANARSATETRSANKIRQDSPHPRPSTLKATGLSPSEETPGEALPTSERMRLVAALFKCCDVDGDMLLNEQDMRRFAAITGFDGSDKDWSTEYHALCRDRHLESTSGLTLPQFEELIDDNSERGCYFSTKDLAVILKRLQEEAEGKLMHSGAASSPDGHHTEEELLAARPELPPGPIAEQALNPSARAAEARRSLAYVIFNHCDRDGDGRLNSRELFAFASQTGFDGSSENWAMEYKSLCKEAKVDPDAGITLDIFWALVNDPSEKGCFCTDAELQQAATEFESRWQGAVAARLSLAAPSSPPRRAADEEQGMVSDLSRSALLRDLFRLCDHNGDGFLDNREMRLFAAHTGFKGSDKDWEKEYRLACIEVGAEPARGPNAQQFGQLANSGNGAICSDVELRSIRLSLQAKATQHHLDGGSAMRKADPHEAVSTRHELVDAVFRACDKDGDGYLSMSEMHRFAVQTGFDGGQEAWAGEYELLCSDNGIPPQHGVKPELLRKLVDDRTVMGCFCDDTELQRMLALWEREDKRRPETPTTEARVCPPEPHPAPQASFPELKMTNKIRQDAPPTEPRPLAQPVQPAAKLQAEIAPAKQSARTALALKLFNALDSDGDRHLNKEEMQRFACLTGFEGNQEDWSSEHQMLCADRGVNPVTGLTPAQFEELVDDKTERGCYFSNEELGLILTRLDEADKVKLPTTTLALSTPVGARASEPRPANKAGNTEPRPDPHLELIDAIFRLCDRDCDKRLNSKETHCVAVHTGFDGTDEQWSEEYRLLCEEHREDPAKGIPCEVLRKLLNDCNDVELRDMMLKVVVPGAADAPPADAGTGIEQQNPPPTRNSLPWGAQAGSPGLLHSQPPLVGIGGSVGPRQTPRTSMEPPRMSLAQQLPVAATTPLLADTSNAGHTTLASALQQPRAAGGNAAAAAETPAWAPSLPVATSATQHVGSSLPEPTSRAELVRAVFHECDVDGNGRLSEQEMFVFARLTEYEGSKVQWGLEYQSLCTDNGVDARVGVDFPLFERLVDDTSPSGIHCTDLELRSMLSVLATARKGPPGFP